MAQPWRMQVTTSCRMRRAGTWNSTSLVTTVGTRAWAARLDKLVQPQLVVRPAAQGQRQIAAIAEGLAQAAQLERAGVVGDVGDQHRDQAVAVGDEIGPVEPALRLAAALLAEAEQPAEPGVGRAVGRDRPAPRRRRRGRGGSRRSAGRRCPSPPDAPARCRRGCCGRRRPAPRCRGSRLARTAPRRSWPRAGRRNAR